ncbi:PHP domain-containing protein [Candidatus Contubernalis alkaliaceticus]|uniref:PHP domain-containing protein n=1 Tax=Candidatus Contubernalis alkaliaceticus TaxID=338645 RepID=UPI001F4BDA7F|nr:PHP domain-containing protein [Candidatus Contubernalis alkalaceticus]UNC90834.1 PHP domain-containing protein [Candidatus Contubernalis alkalaceticus]
MNIDMHVHTNISSACSCIDICQMIDYARYIGLDAICVTDHDTLHGARVAHKIGREKNFLILRGMEVNAVEGDFLVFGLEEDIEEGKFTAKEVLQMVSSAGGAAIAAHPYRRFERALGDKIFSLTDYHAIEVKNGNTPGMLNEMARNAALQLNLPGIGGSDAHRLNEVGRYYTRFKTPVKNERELIEAIKLGEYEAMTRTDEYSSKLAGVKGISIQKVNK